VRLLSDRSAKPASCIPGVAGPFTESTATTRRYLKSRYFAYCWLLIVWGLLDLRSESQMAYTRSSRAACFLSTKGLQLFMSLYYLSSFITSSSYYSSFAIHQSSFVDFTLISIVIILIVKICTPSVSQQHGALITLDVKDIFFPYGHTILSVFQGLLEDFRWSNFCSLFFLSFFRRDTKETCRIPSKVARQSFRKKKSVERKFLNLQYSTSVHLSRFASHF